MWPCWFSLSILDLNLNLLFLVWNIFLGSFFMRSAGCIINDIIDRDIDKNIVRTERRPLASKRISLIEAFLLIIFLIISFFYYYNLIMLQ